MILESKRLLELAGLPVEGDSKLLKESSEVIYEFSSNDGVTVKKDGDKDEDEKDDAQECDEADEVSKDAEEIKESMRVRRAVRSELERMWASGEVFGKTASKKDGVTMGFLGVGFKR
jgi:hypothetical protein